MPELSPKLKQMVDASRALAAPSAEDRERVSRALGRRLAVGAVAAAAATLGVREVAGASAVKTGTLAATTVSAKWLMVSLAVVASGLGGVGVMRWTQAPKEPAPVVISGPKAEPRKSPVVARPEPTRATDLTALPVSPESTAPVNRSPTSPAASRSTASLGRELELLRGAQRALDSGSPSQALSLLGQYASEFPRGALRQEYGAARIIALCAAGQRSSGLKAAEQFLKAEPNSPFARRVRSACGLADPNAAGSTGRE